MTVLTHCLPTGTLGTGEIPVSSVDTGNTTIYLPAGGIGSSKIRGIVVSMHGLPGGTVPQPIPPTISPDVELSTFDSYSTSFKTLLVNDGWAFLCVPYPEDFYVGIGSQAIYNDISNDTGHGSRYVSMTLHWWDHVVNFIHTTYGNWPIVAAGGSWGGWHTLQIASNRQSSIVGYSADVPATIVSNANTAFTTPVNYSLINTTGADVTTTQLNAVTVPGIVTYGTNDEAVGYNSAGSGGTPVSNTDAMLTNAVGAGAPVTRNATVNFHEFTNIDSGTWFTPTGPTALSSLGTLTVNANYDFVSGQCAIYASDNQWHTITFSSTSGTTQFTGCSYSGTTSATVSAGAPVCMTGTGAVGNHQMSIPYWFATTLDPLYPKTY